MGIKIELSGAQENALLTVYPSVAEYAYAAGRIAVDPLDAKEETAISAALGIDRSGTLMSMAPY